jgi:hypothetical protein
MRMLVILASNAGLKKGMSCHNDIRGGVFGARTGSMDSTSGCGDTGLRDQMRDTALDERQHRIHAMRLICTNPAVMQQFPKGTLGSVQAS